MDFVEDLEDDLELLDFDLLEVFAEDDLEDFFVEEDLEDVEAFVGAGAAQCLAILGRPI